MSGSNGNLPPAAAGVDYTGRTARSARPVTDDDIQQRILSQEKIYSDLETLMSPGPMEDEVCPSDLMTAMLYLVPEGESSSMLFRYLFLSRLPVVLSNAITPLDCLPVRELAEVADHLWLVICSLPTPSTAIPPVRAYPPPPPSMFSGVVWEASNTGRNSARRVLLPDPEVSGSRSYSPCSCRGCPPAARHPGRQTLTCRRL